MKSRPLLLFILILSLAIVPSLQLALAASSSSSSSTTTTSTGTHAPFSEKLDVYVAGSTGFWLVSVGPVNATRPGLLSAESVQGVSAYELTAVKTSSATPAAQLFWGEGYRVLKLPFVPDSGVFLNVTATSQSAAQSAASGFNTFLGANFVLTGSGRGNYTFFSPADFTVAGGIIFSAVPSAAEKGLSAITSGATLASRPTPTAIMTGVRSGSSFTHTVSFGSEETGVTASNGTLNFAKAINQANASFLSSPIATSTQVVFHALDGLISSNDGAKIANDQSSFSGTYSITVAANTRFKPNVTILEDPPILTATRILDRGAASSGDLVSVTLLLRNTATGGTVQNVAINDNWWNSYPSLFSLSAGNFSVSGVSLTAGQNVTRVYVLKVTSTASQDLFLPATKVTYSFSLGSGVVTASTKTNQVELRTNGIGPSLMIQAGADVSSGTAMGKVGHYLVTVTNIGNGPALNLQVGDLTNPTLTQGGQVWKFNSSIALTSLTSRNLTQTYTLGWTTPDGSKGTLTSNPVTVILSHVGIQLPLMQLSLSASLTPLILKLGTANATYTLTNTGNVPATSATVTETFASGLTCQKVLTGNATCTSSTFSLTAGPLAIGANSQGKLQMSFASDNYLTEPGTVTTTFLGLKLHTAGNAFIVPAGVVVTRTDHPNPVFARQNGTVSLQIVNHGTLPVYNASVKTNPDAFGKALSGSLVKAYATLSPGSTQSFNYTFQSLTPGNHTTAAITLTFAFAGFTAAYTVYPGNVLVYKDVQATTSTRPSSPVEGANFQLAVEVQNPSSVDVSNVSVLVPIPQGLAIVNLSSGASVIGRTLKLNIPSLAPGGSVTSSATLRAGSDGNINLGNGSLTFQYQGSTIQGVVSTSPITVSVDLLFRYELPIALAVLITIGVAFYMHRQLAPQAK